MKLFLSAVLSSVLAINLVCLLLVFVAPFLSPSMFRFRGDWPVTLGLALAGVSGLVVLSALIAAVLYPQWRSDVTRYQLACLGLLGAYALFVLAYSWHVLKGGI